MGGDRSLEIGSISLAKFGAQDRKLQQEETHSIQAQGTLGISWSDCLHFMDGDMG